MRMADFLSLLKGVRPERDGEYIALCPAHNDHEQSLSIKEADGKILVKCFASCKLMDILKPLDLEPKDLFLDSHEAKLECREIEAIYHYTDANGKPFEVVRTKPKGFYQRRPNSKGGYINNLNGIVPTLYHQDKLSKAIEHNEPIYLVEGEKDVDKLWRLGFVSSCNPMGAGKWRDSYSEALRGADLIIIPDSDKPGRGHAYHVAKSCYGAAGRIRMLELPDGSKDFSDWLDNGHTIEELTQLADTSAEYEPSDGGIKLRRMADIQAESVNWLWPPYIPKGKLTLLEGDPGVGKSWVSLAVATAVSLGNGLLGQEEGEPANVVIASAEDGLGDTIRPRLDAMGADNRRIFAIDGALVLDLDGFTLLETYLEKKQPTLLIIDPLVAYLGSNIDIHRANETRAVMSQLARLAEKFDAAILAVRHLTKGGMSKAIYRGLGSIDFTASCRSVLLAGCDSEKPNNQAIVHIKSNLAPTGPSIGYELKEDHFYWTGESTLTAAQILAADNDEANSALNEALFFLKDELADGALPAKDVYRNADNIGISKRTLDRAKAQLGVTSRKQGEKGRRGGGVWVWELSDDLDCQDCRTKEFGNLNYIEAKKEVVTERLGNDNDNPPNYPTSPCHVCGCGDYWLREASIWGRPEWLCDRCHPEPKDVINDESSVSPLR